MSAEAPDGSQFTFQPQRGEDHLATSARISTWALHQLTPEQRLQVSQAPLASILILPDDHIWRKGAVPLMDRPTEIFVGIRLNHPLINAESFDWEGLHVALTHEEERRELVLRITKEADKARFFEIKLLNLHQDEDQGPIVHIGMYDKESELTLPLPMLIEGTESIFLSIEEETEEDFDAVVDYRDRS